MKNNYLYTFSPIITNYFKRECPKKILIISNDYLRYTQYFKFLLKDINELDIKYVTFGESTNDENEIMFNDILMNPTNYNFDTIFITDLLEVIDIEEAKEILITLLLTVNKSIFALTPYYKDILDNNDNIVENTFREYHPIIFNGFDFSYYLQNTMYGDMQYYVFYPFKDYEDIDLDQFEVIENNESKNMNIGYVLPHGYLTGGIKCLLEQIRQLTKKGHNVYIIRKYDNVKEGIPTWSNLKEHDYKGLVNVPINEDYSKYIQKLNLDIVVLGFTPQIKEFKNYNIPVMYWEQGYEQLYSDFKNLLTSDNEGRNFIEDLYRSPIYLLSVSKQVSDILYGKFNRNSKLLKNGIDTNFYKDMKLEKEGNVILLVGNPTLKFKGFDFALNSLSVLWNIGERFKVKWVCQEKPTNLNYPFPIEIYVSPSQEELVNIYNQSDILLSSSLYESFPMPPIEAMACGTPVIAIDNGGIHEYAVPGDNLILVNQGNTIDLVSSLALLLKDEKLRKHLSISGRKTAEKYDFKLVVNELERYLYSIVCHYNRED